MVDQFLYNKDSEVLAGTSMWMFGASGVYVYSPDGSKQLHHVVPEHVCEDRATFTGHDRLYCRFHDVITDGKRFVWASTSANPHHITVFNIDTGALVGKFESCANPNDLEYHPLRDEIWARCEGSDDDDGTTHLDVFTASSPSGEIQTNILLKARALEEGLTSSGYSVIHPDLGDVGYLTDDSNPNLFQIDLSSKEIMNTLPLDVPAMAHGLYEAAFSPTNQHIFVRALMCCTCGDESSDLESCGRSTPEPVSPTTGKSA